MDLFDEGINYLEGIGCQQNIKEGLSIINKLAEDGNREAQFCLARFYWDGQYIKKNDEKTIFWYEKSAENGHPFAQLWLGNNYMNGTKTPIDYQKAFYWYKKAVCNGVPMAYYNLGICYYYGLGVEKDIVEGEKYILQAAERYVIIADLMLIENSKYSNSMIIYSQERLLKKYNHLIGFDKEITKCLADAYRKGYGVKLDRKKALILYNYEILDDDEDVLRYRQILNED